MANRWIHIGRRTALTPILAKPLSDYKVKEDLSEVDFSTVEGRPKRSALLNNKKMKINSFLPDE